MDLDLLWWLLSVLLVAAGLAGTIIPAIPGIPLIFAGLFFIAWIDNFTIVGWKSLAVLGVLALAGWAVDFIAGALGARYLGASSRAFWGATVGAIVGMFFGLPGIILGPFFGAVVGEISGGASLTQSGRSGFGTWIGMVVATACKLAIAFLMIGIVIFNLGFSSNRAA